jgi:hypothetical protein
MSGTIVQNKTSYAIVHFTANGSCNLVGNSTTSEIALTGQVITGAVINKIWHGTNSGNSQGSYWKVQRGSNVVAVVDGTGLEDYTGNGTALSMDSTGNLTVSINGDVNAYIMVEVRKLPQSLQNSTTNN